VGARLSLTRRVRFAAAHRYRRPEWDEATNARTFGACANPHFHGHSYVCDVTVTGPVDPATGFVVDLGLLDDVLAREVRARYDHRNLNLETPEFAEGAAIPTGEELARVIAERVGAALAAGESRARVLRVVVAEDEGLWSTWEAA
jgi:6-pyruvoyltetrahydropterin/6-carboxytetrahydropterin synthase